MTSAPSSAELDRTVARLLDDLAHHGLATAEIPALGERAIAPLTRYLDGPPQSFPHARQLAARLLGLIGGPAAVETLRSLLTRHDLAILSPALAQSEYAVKDEAVVQLLRLERTDLGDEFLAAFRRDHLPSAADALARCGVSAAIPDLVTALEDDLLAQRAADALRRFGPRAVPELVASVRERHGERSAATESRVSRCRRIAAATLLGEIRERAAVTPLRFLLQDAHPAVAAAAAAALAALDPDHVSPGQCRAIIAGAVSPEWRVWDRCREAADSLADACVAAAVAAVHDTETVDLYDVPVPIDRARRRWLIAFILEHAGAATGQLTAPVQAVDASLLVEAIAEVHAPRAVTPLAAFTPHPDPLVRAALAHALPPLGGGALEPLLRLSDDRTRDVRLAAARGLRALVAANPPLAGLVPAADGGPWVRCRRWWLRRALRRAAARPRGPG